MGIETQVILAGHVRVDQIVTLLKSQASGNIIVRDMQRPEYKIVDFQKVDGSWTSLNVFLESWAADDYYEAYAGPSTLLTLEFSPENYNIVQSIATAIGGLARRTAAEPWATLEQARS